MGQEPRSNAVALFTYDITAGGQSVKTDPREEQTQLLRQILLAQDRQNELLEEMINQFGAAQKQRNQELSQWKQANPGLARSCRTAAETLSKVQVEYLRTLTDEVEANEDVLGDGEFMLNEFVDRFGPRLAHLNGVLQVLAQLGSTAATANAQPQQ
jgi:hypothetical protein